jgi:hypothetical protein
MGLILASVIGFGFVAAAPPRDLPRDFALRMELGLCWRDVVDTKSDRYIRDLATGSGKTRSAKLALTDEPWRELWRWIQESQFFGLPAELSASDAAVSETGERMSMIPSETYVVEVWASGRHHRVEFNDDNPAATSELLTRVRRLVGQLEQFFTGLPQVKRLPEPAVGCA